MVIISSDRDLYQLINPNVQIYSFLKHEMINEEYLEEHYHLNPKQWIELKMIQGDPSDNIPGIKGIGKVTALKLIQQFGTIENIYQNLVSLSDSVRNKLIAGKETLPLMRELVTILTDYSKINFDISMLERKSPDEKILKESLCILQLPSLVPVINDLMKGA